LDICAGAPLFLVTPLLMGLVCLLSQDRFEDQIRRLCTYAVHWTNSDRLHRTKVDAVASIARWHCIPICHCTHVSFR